MRKNSENGPALSFFSFQDIITSVTGIMFLIVILIALLIFELKPARPSDPAKQTAAEQTKTDLQELARQVGTLRARVRDHREWLKQNSVEADRLMKMDFQSIEKAIAALQVQNVQLEKSLEDVRRETAQATQCGSIIERRTAEKSAESKSLADKNKSDEKKITKLNSILSELKKQVAKKKQVVIASDRNESKTPILVECGKDGVRAKSFNAESVMDFRTPDAIHHAVSINKFIEWAKDIDTNSYYFVLFASPDAFGYVELLSLKLKMAGKERGIEILPDNESTLF